MDQTKQLKNIIQCSKTLGNLHDFLVKSDETNNVPSVSGAHHSPSCIADVKVILDELNSLKVLQVAFNRKHKSFKKLKDVLHANTKDSIITYVKEHLKQKYFKKKR